MLAHVLPYVLWVAIGALAALLPESAQPCAPWFDAARTAAAAAALVVFARGGAYPELRATETPAKRATVLAVGAGVAAAVLWMPLAELLPRLGSRDGFDLGAGPLLVAVRVAGSVAVIPFAEELFVRSLLPRFVDARAPGEDWRARAVGVFTPISFALSALFFAVTHPEWAAALAVGVLWNALLAHTRRLRDTVLAHAVANALLAAWVLATGDTRWW